VNHFLGFGGLLVLFALVTEIKTICGFNHTVNNIVHADKHIYVVSIIHPLVAAAVAVILVHCERVPRVSNAD